MIQDKIFFDEKDPTGVSYNTPFTVYGSYQGRLWSKTPTGSIKFYTQNSDLSVYATTGSNQFSGSQTVTGSLTVTGGITGSVTTASYVEYTGVANKPALVSSSAQVTYSGLTGVPAGIVSSSAQVGGYGVFATTGSNQFNGSQAVTGSLTVTGQVVAQTLNVQQVTSSIVYSSGSNIFGNSLGNTQQFTGSVSVTGSLTVTTNGTELQVTSTGVNLGNALTDSHIISGSLRVNPNGLFVSGSGNVGVGTTSPTDFGSTYKVISIDGAGGGGVLDLMNTGVRTLTLAVDGGEPSISSRVSGNPIVFKTNNAGTIATRLTIASTGAATFSSSITTNGDISYYNAGNLNALITSGATANGRMYFYASATADIGLQAGGNSWFLNNLGIGTNSPSATLDIGSGKNLSGTDPISVYTDVRVASAVTGGLIGYNLRMVALAGSYTVANMYGIKTNTAVVQSGVTVTNSYGIYIGRTDDPTSGGIVTNKYALVTEATAGNVGIGTPTPATLLNLKSSTTTELRLESIGGTYRSFIGFRTDAQQWDLGVNLNDLQDALSINYKGTEKMRISTGFSVSVPNATYTTLFDIASVLTVGSTGIVNVYASSGSGRGVATLVIMRDGIGGVSQAQIGTQPTANYFTFQISGTNLQVYAAIAAGTHTVQGTIVRISS
jgi:hypothetical protein